MPCDFPVNSSFLLLGVESALGCNGGVKQIRALPGHCGVTGAQWGDAGVTARLQPLPYPGWSLAEVTAWHMWQEGGGGAGAQGHLLSPQHCLSQPHRLSLTAQAKKKGFRSKGLSTAGSVLLPSGRVWWQVGMAQTVLRQHQAGRGDDGTWSWPSGSVDT